MGTNEANSLRHGWCIAIFSAIVGATLPFVGEEFLKDDDEHIKRALAQDFLEYYYTSVTSPDDDCCWEHLGSQVRETASTKDDYEEFWSSVQSVGVKNVRELGINVFTASLTYEYLDGRRWAESTAFELDCPDSSGWSFVDCQMKDIKIMDTFNPAGSSS